MEFGPAQGFKVQRNSISGYEGGAIVFFEPQHLHIARNTVSGPGPGLDPAGIRSFGPADHNRIERNSVSGNGFVGVIVEQGHGNEVIGNQIFRNREGMILIGDANTIARNTITDSLGADDGSGFGIVLEAGEENLIAHNTIERSRAVGIWIDIPELELPTAGNALRSNTVREAGSDGISVGSTAADTLLDGNFAEGAGDDGIDVESTTTTLTKNTANRNHDLGIEAVAGVTDGGGNRARGNGNPLQCTNVFCK